MPPAGRFPAAYKGGARRCIAYLTIEAKAQIPVEFRNPIGNRVFGCDDCLAVCPWNKFAGRSREQRFAARTETDNPPIADLLALDDATFRERFQGTPVKRTGRARLVRNALVAAGNSGDESLLPQVVRLLGDAAPLVRGMAVWALRQLADAAVISRHAKARLPSESDSAVREEWER